MSTFTTSLSDAYLDSARKLAALRTIDDVITWAAGLGHPAATALAVYFGYATALLGDLVGIIDQDRAELIHSRSQVRELADLLAEQMARHRIATAPPPVLYPCCEHCAKMTKRDRCPDRHLGICFYGCHDQR